MEYNVFKVLKSVSLRIKIFCKTNVGYVLIT